jgi:hypothetical protein
LIDSWTYLEQKLIKGLKPKFHVHTGTKMMFKPNLKVGVQIIGNIYSIIR